MESSSSIASPQLGSREHARVGGEMADACASHMWGVHAMQVASTSRACNGAGSRGGAPTEGSRRPSAEEVAPQEPAAKCRDQDETGNRTEVRAKVIALREGDALLERYTYAVHAGPKVANTDAQGGKNLADVVDLSTPPKATPHGSDEVAAAAKSNVAARRNTTRSTNKQANTVFAQEMKDSVAGGRAPKITITENETHLKARWHAAAKELTYKLMPFKKEGWKGYSIFEKGVIHQELNLQYKFEPLVNPKCVEKYLAGHLRSSRAVWKAHWLRYGDSKRHHNCPKDAWQQLIQWWPTEACKEESAEMVGRRSLVHNSSNTGRTALAVRMEEEVSNTYADYFGHDFCDENVDGNKWKSMQMCIVDVV